MYSKYSVFRIYVGSAGVLQILETVCRLLSSAVKITVIVKSLMGQVCSDFYHIILNMSSASLYQWVQHSSVTTTKTLSSECTLQHHTIGHRSVLAEREEKVKRI